MSSIEVPIPVSRARACGGRKGYLCDCLVVWLFGYLAAIWLFGYLATAPPRSRSWPRRADGQESGTRTAFIVDLEMSGQ